MRFALFHEIPVAKPWTPGDEHRAYHDVITEAVAADRNGWHGFWTVEHHFLEEFSHCSNPEVLYGAIAAQTENLRLGYGVRLQPKPYNHPVRSAESAAVLDLISSGRVDFGTGRSSTRTELEGFGIMPDQTRGMWREAIGHVVECWTNDEASFDGEHWSMPKRRVLPKPFQTPHPPMFGATGSPGGHELMGELGLGLCSFGVAVPPEELAGRIDLYRKGLERCTSPVGAYVNDCAAAFLMCVVAPTRQEARAIAEASFLWYPKASVTHITSVVRWMDDMAAGRDGTYDYLDDVRKMQDDGLVEHISMDWMLDIGAVICGTPDDAVEQAQAFRAAGVDLLLCLTNPWKIPLDKRLQTVELMGRHVIPSLADPDRDAATTGVPESARTPTRQ
ncbi:MAG TPA: LLM class flavin-dependent oxidoreductase [Acidimicrobiales bacterium]|jgi:alkanesulfonate monooxygenase SsuD/methylene tetrahydromethanopterin reductase-like flavin-dependent oxidoreductase (luciferase family)